MPRSLSLELLLLLAIIPALRADPETGAPASPKVSAQLLQDIFQKALTPDQLAALKAPATPEQLVDVMTPEQKTSARKKLQELESQTQDPKQFPIIAKGYAILQAQDDALRVGWQMQELEPKQSQGFAIAASARLEKGQYEEAVRLAHEALARNPRDKEALVVLKMSERRTSVANRAAPTGQLNPTAASPAPADTHSNEPYVLAAKFKNTAPPPALALTKEASAPKTPKGSGSLPLLPLAAATGLSLTAYGIARSKQTVVSEDGLNPSPDISPEEQQRARTGSMILVGTFVASFAVLELGPGVAAGALALARNGFQPAAQRTSQLLTSESGAIFPKEQAAAERTATMQKLPWNSWAQYPKTLLNGQEYAKIGERLYTRHAIDHMMPRGLNIGAAVEGRGMSPTFVEDVIQRGTQSVEATDGIERTVYSLGTAKVITEQGGRLVVSINPFFHNKP